MHELISRLEQRLEQVRQYKAAPNGYVTDLSQQVALLQGCRQPVLGSLPAMAGDRWVFSDMAMHGPGDQCILAQRWG